MHTTLQIWQIKSEVYEDSIVWDLCVCERYNSADSCSGTCIYQLLKGMILNIVLKSTHEKQATKICSGKVVMQTTPLCVSISRNINCRTVCLHVEVFVLLCNKCTYPSADKKKWILLIYTFTFLTNIFVLLRIPLILFHQNKCTPFGQFMLWMRGQTCRETSRIPVITFCMCFGDGKRNGVLVPCFNTTSHHMQCSDHSHSMFTYS